MHASSSLCTWVHFALAILAPAPVLDADTRSEVSHVVYVCSGLCIIFGHAIPLVAVYQFELATKLQFLRARGVAAVQHVQLPDREVQLMVLVMMTACHGVLANLLATAIAVTTTVAPASVCPGSCHSATVAPRG
jgi:hypothetical protein